MKKLAFVLSVVLCMSVAPVYASAANRQDAQAIQLYNQAVEKLHKAENVEITETKTGNGINYAYGTKRAATTMKRTSSQLGSGDNAQLVYRVQGDVEGKALDSIMYYKDGYTYQDDTRSESDGAYPPLWRTKGRTGYVDAYSDRIFATIDAEDPYARWRATELEDGGTQLTRVLTKEAQKEWIVLFGLWNTPEVSEKIRSSNVYSIWMLDKQGRIVSYRTYVEIDYDDGGTQPLYVDTQGTISYGTAGPISFPSNLGSYTLM